MKNLKDIIIERLHITKDTGNHNHNIYSFTEFDDELRNNLWRLTTAEYETLIDQLKTIVKINIRQSLINCDYIKITDKNDNYEYFKSNAEIMLSNNIMSKNTEKSIIKRFYAVEPVRISCYFEQDDNNLFFYFISRMDNNYYIYDVI